MKRSELWLYLYLLSYMFQKHPRTIGQGHQSVYFFFPHKVPNVPEDNWVWSSQGAINMHLPERYVHVHVHAIGRWVKPLRCLVWLEADILIQFL